MTENQMREVCVRELLFGTMFLSDYERELTELSGEPEFMQMIEQISASVPETVEFSLEPFLPEFKRFKLSTINETFFNERVKYRFPAYCEIVDSVTNRGKTALSATISIYYAIRYVMIGKLPIMPSTVKASDESVSDYDFRQKWPAKYRCDDGHYVRSKNEQLVDNWLYNHNICHAYEPLVVDKKTKREYISDFFLPQLKMYIEVWGYENPEYLQRKERKIAVYRASGLALLQMTDREVTILDDFLHRNILAKM